MIKTHRMILNLIPCLILTTAGSSADAEEPKQPAEDPQMAQAKAFQKAFQTIYQETRTANMLVQVRAYRQLSTDFGGKNSEFEETIASFLSWKLSAAGRYGEAHEVFDLGSPVGATSPEEVADQKTSLEGFEAVEAVAAVARASQDARAIFINEGHHVPQHRALSLRLLPLLRKQGFTHFAAETLTEVDKDLHERGYPTPKTGTYTDEPLYADLVRTAVRLGFRVIAYEARGGPKEREPTQARNLIERVFDEDPDARLVVHLGYGHNRESVDSFRGAGAMAYHFQSMTGIDPLTVDQTELTEHSDATYEHPLYEELCGASESPDPVAFANSQGKLWSLPGTDRDVTVCLPRSRPDHGRPTWLALGGLRRPVPLPNDVCGNASPCLVEARPSDEGDDAIPIDRVDVRAGEPAAALMLPDGKFTVDVLDIDGTKVHSSIRSVGD